MLSPIVAAYACGVSNKARRLLVGTAIGIFVWFLCVLFLWALRPLSDAIPVGINSKGVWTSQTVTCNSLFHSDARDNSPLPTISRPLAYTREACTLVHSQARQVFVFDVLVTMLVLAAVGFIMLRSRRLNRRPESADMPALFA